MDTLYVWVTVRVTIRETPYMPALLIWMPSGASVLVALGREVS